MTSTLLRRGVELTDDAAFAGRVRRLARVSSVALGAIVLLAWRNLEVPWLVMAALIAGWCTMPAVLSVSVNRPRSRYLLMVPAGLVSGALLAVSVAYLPSDAAAQAGWLLITAGVLMGATLGMWFWYRMLPVPARFEDPFGNGRMALIRAHIGLVVSGMVLVAVSFLH
jgi:hypothetical protein